ncbi:hypothetical protein PVAND_016396 [Polypedilum vanderplanki]|uniref:TBC1 domain family member 7 n=1 Tax=Polypedilum vanderplanki TaxID=319348 RepID=A0A9J6BFQ4_POLVA|nr:hypothetical protein PVAND_016396 [Polypedilum vanderplanki]
MMEDARNFRSIYYEKVGCRSVEEKKSLEILLKENPVYKQKLFQFLKLFSVPTIHRSLLYCLALNVYPVYMESKEFVMQQKKEIYSDLLRALNVMKFIDEKTPRARIFYAMYLLETKKLNNSVNLFKDEPFPLIADVIIENLDVDPVESYFISKNFYKFSEEIERELPKLTILTSHYLEKEDEDLFKFLDSKCILEQLPFERWFPAIWNPFLNKLSLIRIFDKVASGSTVIVVFVFIVICSFTRFQLKSHPDDVVKIIEVYASGDDESEKSELIVNKTIDLWQKHCSKK